MQYKIPDDSGTSPTQGEKPAEARADHEAATEFAEHHRYGRGEAVENLAAAYLELLSSPQEGATAVGADKIEALKASLRAAARWYARQSAENHGPAHEDAKPETWDTWQAADIIEALQWQVAEANESRELAWRCQHSQRQDLLARAEAAEASLRTLGNALERAREALAEHDLTNDGCKRCGEESYQKCGAWTIDHAPECVFAVLTPPTRDTSCEAVAKQEPSLEQQLSDARAAIHSPHRIHTEVYDGLVDPAEAEYLARHHPPDKGADEIDFDAIIATIYEGTVGEDPGKDRVLAGLKRVAATPRDRDGGG